MRTSSASGLLRVVLLLTALSLALAGCGRGESAEETGLYEIADGEANGYDTAFIAAVQVPTEEEDGYILLRNNWDNQADLGGWAIEGRRGRVFPLPPSTFMEPEGELRIHLTAGDSDSDDLYMETDEEILPWDRLRLVDAAGDEVARFTYGR